MRVVEREDGKFGKVASFFSTTHSSNRYMMQPSEQEREELAIINKPATFDSIPQDVALAIVERVKGWVEESKTFQEKEKARRTRDSTLRAIALSCRKNFHFYFPALLQNVTVDPTNLINIQNLFQRENHGHLVRSLHLQGLPFEVSETAASLLWKDFAAFSGLPSSVAYDARCDEGFDMLLTGIFRNVPSIETLIVESTAYIDGLFFEPYTFLANSLKKLYIFSDSGENRGNLSVKNGIWLLLFVPSLSEAALSLEYSVINDLQFLLEFGDTIEGLSRVSKLSLAINFISDASKSKTWWGLQEDSYSNSAQVNQKTFAVSQLLRCVNTNVLVSLEIGGNDQDLREGDETLFFTECLTVLHHSFNSLLHLRSFGLPMTRNGRTNSKCLSNFKNMKVLTLDGDILYELQVGGKEIAVPSGLEIVSLPYYSDKEFSAEDALLQFIKLRGSFLPKLREVVVPKAPVFAGELAVNVEKENWTRKRERLEKEEIFTSGRVILRKAEECEMIGDASKPGEVFLSTIRWISS